ncbi:MAG: ERF family protein [Nitrosopumilaceae archaeon]|nr:ERF family protein [Nitrosopumilaceae archaeon]
MEETQKNQVETKQPTFGKLAEALSKAQGIMGGAKKDKQNPFFKSTYADLASVFDVIREPFACNGLSIVQTLDLNEKGQQIMITRLMHSSGEFVDSKMLIPYETNPQKLGSLITYYRRYSLMAIAGIPAEDDDGNAASGNVPKVQKVQNSQPIISEEQYTEISELLSNNEDLRENVMKYLETKHGLNGLRNIPVSVFNSIIPNIRQSKEGK